MVLFGYHFSTEELLFMGWLFSALAHALPTPDSCKPNKLYLFLYNITQVAAANPSLIHSWVAAIQPTCETAPENKVVLVPNPPKPPNP